MNDQSPEDEIPLPSEPVLNEEQTIEQLRADTEKPFRERIKHLEQQLGETLENFVAAYNGRSDERLINENLRAEILRLRDSEQCWIANAKEFERARQEVEAKLAAERERHIMQLAAISTLSISNTPNTLAAVENCHPDYQTQTFKDVKRVIEREMKWRESARELYAALGNDGVTTNNLLSAKARVVALQHFREVAEPQ